jgi:hypothetical protein
MTITFITGFVLKVVLRNPPTVDDEESGRGVIEISPRSE